MPNWLVRIALIWSCINQNPNRHLSRKKGNLSRTPVLIFRWRIKSFYWNIYLWKDFGIENIQKSPEYVWQYTSAHISLSSVWKYIDNSVRYNSNILNHGSAEFTFQWSKKVHISGKIWTKTLGIIIHQLIIQKWRRNRGGDDVSTENNTIDQKIYWHREYFEWK